MFVKESATQSDSARRNQIQLINNQNKKLAVDFRFKYRILEKIVESHTSSFEFQSLALITAVGTACAIDGRLLCQRMKINALILCTEAEIRFHCRLINHHRLRHFQSRLFFYFGFMLRFWNLSRNSDLKFSIFWLFVLMKSSWNRFQTKPIQTKPENHQTVFDQFIL